MFFFIALFLVFSLSTSLAQETNETLSNTSTNNSNTVSDNTNASTHQKSLITSNQQVNEGENMILENASTRTRENIQANNNVFEKKFEERFSCEILSGSERDSCYFGEAMNKGDVSYCDEIKNVAEKENCVKALIRFKEKNKAEVKGIVKSGEEYLKDEDKDGVPDIKDECSHTPEGVSVDERGCKIINPETLEGCLEVSQRDDCYLRFALKNKDKELCDKIEDGIKKDSCLATVGGGFEKTLQERYEEGGTECEVSGSPRTPDDCKKLAKCKGVDGTPILDTQTKIDECIFHIAWENNNISFCDEISNPSKKEDCKKALSNDFEGRHPKARMPTSIPAPILEAGAEQEFIQFFCKSVRSEIEGQMMTAVSAMIDYYKEMNEDPDLNLGFDYSEIEKKREDIENAVNKVCASNKDTFSIAAEELSNLIEGENGMEELMDETMRSFQNKIRERINSLKEVAYAESQNNFLGPEKSSSNEKDFHELIEEVKQEYLSKFTINGQNVAGIPLDELNNWLTPNMQLEGGTREELEQAIQQVMNYEQQLRNEEKQKASQDFKQAEKKGAELERFTTKLDTMMTDLRNKMMALERKQKSTLITYSIERFEGMRNLIQKVVDYKISKAEEKKEELKAEGINTQLFEDAIKDIKDKMNELDKKIEDYKKEVRKAGDEQEVWVLEGNMTKEINNFMNELNDVWKEKQEELNARLKKDLQKKQAEKFFEKLQEFKENYENQVNSTGINTTRMQAIYNDLLVAEDNAKNAYEAGNYDACMIFLATIKGKYELLDEAWNEAKKQETITMFLDKVMSFQEKISQGIKKAQKLGLNTTTLEGLNNELNTQVNNARDNFNSGSVEEAYEYVKQARETLKQIKLEWDALNKLAVSGESK